jgi:hypothetical protein
MQLAREANEKGDTNPMLVSIPNPLPKSSAHNYLSGTFLMRYDTSVGSIQNPVFFSQSSAGIDHSGFAISVNETDPTPSQVIEPSVIEVMLNNQPLTSYLPIQTIEDAHNFINALEATLSEIKREIPMSKKNKSQYIKKFRTLRSELFIAIENDFHLLWEDELLEDIYADLLQRLEDRVEQALEGLLVEINRLIMSEDVKSSLIGRL